MPATASPTPLLVPIVEAGRMLGVSRTSVYALIDAGRLPVVKIGRSARIPHESIVALVAELLTSNGSPAAKARLPETSTGLDPRHGQV